MVTSKRPERKKIASLSTNQPAQRVIAVVGVNLRAICKSRLPLLQAFQKAGFKVVVIAPLIDKCDLPAKDIKRLNADIKRTFKKYDIAFEPCAMPQPIKDRLWSYRQRRRLLATLHKHHITDVFVFYEDAMHVFMTAISSVCFKTTSVVLGALDYRQVDFGEGGGIMSHLKSLWSWLSIARAKQKLRQVTAHATHVIIQNTKDADYLVAQNLVDAGKVVVVNGAGIDLKAFPAVPLDRVTPLTFLYVGRLQEEKGFVDYCEAVKIVRKKYPGMRFQVIGGFMGCTLKEKGRFKNMARDAGVDYFGEVVDVKPYLRDAHVVVFPSYGEATSKALLEALATGRPLITTNVSGCEQSVTPQENGVVVHVKDPWAISNAMTYFIEHSQQLQKMATVSRQLAETKFDNRLVNKKIVSSLTQKSK